MEEALDLSSDRILNEYICIYLPHSSYIFRYAVHYLKGGLLSYSSEIFSGRHPGQDVKVLRRFGIYSVPFFRVCCFGSTSTLKMGKELFPDTSKNLHILTLLSARENFIEFSRRESFKTYTHISAQNHIFLQGCYL